MEPALKVNDSVDRQSSAAVVHINQVLYEQYTRNRAVSDVTFWLLFVSYSILIAAGSLGNVLVMLAVGRNKSEQYQRVVSIKEYFCS